MGLCPKTPFSLSCGWIRTMRSIVPYMVYTHMLCKRKAQFFRHTEYFLDVLQLYSSSSTGQWSLPCTSIKISAFLICGASRSDTRK